MKLYLPSLAILGCLPLVCAEFDSYGKDAPPEIVERAKQLVAQQHYADIEAMITQIDAQYINDRGESYFRSLVGIVSAVNDWNSPPHETDYPRLWLERKICWKILLTPYSRIEDAPIVQRIRDDTGGFGAPVPAGNFDRNQFVVMRQDGLRMLMAYRDSLRARMIPNYQHKPGHTMMSVVMDPKSMETFIAKRKAEEAQLTRNDHENAEQDALTQAKRTPV